MIWIILVAVGLGILECVTYAVLCHATKEHEETKEALAVKTERHEMACSRAAEWESRCLEARGERDNFRRLRDEHAEENKKLLKQLLESARSLAVAEQLTESRLEEDKKILTQAISFLTGNAVVLTLGHPQGDRQRNWICRPATEQRGLTYEVDVNTRPAERNLERLAKKAQDASAKIRSIPGE